MVSIVLLKSSVLLYRVVAHYFYVKEFFHGAREGKVVQ